VASDWSTFVDAVVSELTTSVPGLADPALIVHRYSPYDPGDLQADVGERHLSVFPVADIAQETAPFTTAPGGDLLTETYRIVYWEHAGDESSRAVSDEDAAYALLDLAAATRERFFVIANLTLSDATDVRYLGMAFPERAGHVRWFALGVRATRVKQAT
jgi:hypothetical protein